MTGAWSGTYLASCEAPWQETCGSPVGPPPPTQSVEWLIQEDSGQLTGLLILKGYFSAMIPVSGHRLPDNSIALSGDATTRSRCDTALHYAIAEWHVYPDASLSQLSGSFIITMTHNLNSCYYTDLIVHGAAVMLTRE